MLQLSDYASAKRAAALFRIRGLALLLLFASEARWVFPQNQPPPNSTAISPVEQVTDAVLFEDINDPAKRSYLPRFRLATQTVAGETQYRVRLTKEGSGANLEVYLEKYPAAKLGDSVRSAEEIPYEAKVVLRYDLPTNATGSQTRAYKELIFQEVTHERGGLKAVLRLADLQERDGLIYALESPKYDTTLLVRRTLTVRTHPVAEIYRLSAFARERRSSLAHAGRAGVVVSKQQWDEVDQMDEQVESLKRIGTPVTLTLDDTVPRQPFAFDRSLYTYVFAGILPNPGARPQLVRQQVAWQDRYYSYFRPADQPDRWYYLPDRFLLVVPELEVQFSGMGENQSVELKYLASPQTQFERLKAAEPTLQPAANRKLTFEPLLVEDAKLWLALPGSGNALYQQRPGASVDLRDGLKDRLHLSLNQFQDVYQALFSTSFTGEVRVAPDSVTQERIPVEMRVAHLKPEELWDKVVKQIVPATYQKTIQVKAKRTWFSSDVSSLIVEFKSGETVELDPNRLEVAASVWLPMRDFVLSSENSGQYCYTVTAIREQDGKSKTSEPSCKTATILYPAVP
jgi:hypothetical protein